MNFPQKTHFGLMVVENAKNVENKKFIYLTSYVIEFLNC